MRVIVLKEEDIKTLLEKLELLSFRLKQNENQKERQFISDINRKFHYEIVSFFQEQGSTFPS